MMKGLCKHTHVNIRKIIPSCEPACIYYLAPSHPSEDVVAAAALNKKRKENICHSYSQTQNLGFSKQKRKKKISPKYKDHSIVKMSICQFFPEHFDY